VGHHLVVGKRFGKCWQMDVNGWQILWAVAGGSLGDLGVKVPMDVPIYV